MKKVIYYVTERSENPVWDWVISLAEDERNKCFEYIAYLEAMGEDARRPVSDYLGDKIYELRPKQTRILYFFMLKDYAVLVHAFRKKTPRVPEREMKTAKSRMKDFLLRFGQGEIEIE